jgi:hypothetical protein
MGPQEEHRSRWRREGKSREEMQMQEGMQDPR